MGPTLSFRGIDNAAYYRLVERRHRSTTSTPPAPATSLNVRHPHVAAADHGLAALLGHRDARRRLPLRPGRHAGPRVPRRRPARPPSSTSCSRTRSCRQVKLIAEPWDVGDGRLPGRQLPAAVDGVERQVPRHHPRLLARRAVDSLGDFASRFTGSLGPVRATTAAGRSRSDQLRHRARRLHAARPGHLQRQAQRGQRRGQPRRREPQPVVELRHRGADRRPRGPRPARRGSSATCWPRCCCRQGVPMIAARRRDRPHPAGQQQRATARTTRSPGSTGIDADKDLLDFTAADPAAPAAPGLPAPAVLRGPADPRPASASLRHRLVRRTGTQMEREDWDAGHGAPSGCSSTARRCRSRTLAAKRIVDDSFLCCFNANLEAGGPSPFPTRSTTHRVRRGRRWTQLTARATAWRAARRRRAGDCTGAKARPAAAVPRRASRCVGRPAAAVFDAPT